MVNVFNRSVELERKSTRSVRIYNIAAISIVSVVFSLLVLSFGLYLAQAAVAARFWVRCHIAVAVLFWVGVVMGVKQRLRGGYLLSRICMALLIATLALYIALLIYMQVNFGTVYWFAVS